MTSIFDRLFRNGTAEGTEVAPSATTPPSSQLLPDGDLDYQQAKDLARHENPDVRRELAARQDVAPEILYFLADDDDPAVRRALVNNQNTPALAHLVLVEDMDEGVRADLAGRIVRLAPGLAPDERDRARLAAYQVLERLAQDHLPRIRKILSDALKDVVDAPPEVISRLARDVEEAVSAPILEFSPVLRDEDLLDIISESPTTAALSAISRRRRVAADVADAIAATDDITAIGVLLGNSSAQLREETLDALISRSEPVPVWHEPLVQRPALHKDAAARLARFVADRLIQVLLEREDLSPETLQEVKRVVHRRLEETENGEVARHHEEEEPQFFKAPEVEEETAIHWTDVVREAWQRASDLGQRGELSEAVILQSVKRGEEEFVAAAIAVRADLPLAVVQAAIRAQSARGTTAVVWKAGLSPTASVQVQSRIGRVPPPELISAAEDDTFGLSESEMEWQLEMYAKVAEDGVF